eukprot:4408643-Alexandrium_andersonii.AAC.1
MRVRAPILQRAEQAMTHMAVRNVRLRRSMEAMLRQPMQPGGLRSSSSPVRLPMLGGSRLCACMRTCV